MRLSLLALLTLLSGWSQPGDWQAGVVRVSEGSGFVVAVRSGRAYIVTCSHVIEGDPKPTVRFQAAPEERYGAEVRDLQGGRRDGLALLVVDKPPADVRALDAATDAPVPGTPVGFAGYPESLGAFTSVSAKIAAVRGTEFFLDRDAPEGFSGGPVLRDGRIVGVVYGRKGGFGSAVPSAIVDIYLRGLDVRWGGEAPKAEERKTVPATRSAPAAGTARENAKDGLKYVWIPPGKFMMGCSPGDQGCDADEKPAREVTISQGFWMGQTEVTQAAYQQVTGANLSAFKGTQRPVEQVNWDEAQDYCGKVGLRLPTDAEWEYAARAGNPDLRYGGLESIAWYGANSGHQTQDVARKQPNAWGLYDMLGNVWEWTADLYPNTTERILRGGSWDLKSWFVRVSYRLRNVPTNRYSYIGFRCAGELR